MINPCVMGSELDFCFFFPPALFKGPVLLLFAHLFKHPWHIIKRKRHWTCNISPFKWSLLNKSFNVFPFYTIMEVFIFLILRQQNLGLYVYQAHTLHLSHKLSDHFNIPEFLNVLNSDRLAHPFDYFTPGLTWYLNIQNLFFLSIL